MATTFNEATGDGSNKVFTFTFQYLKDADVKVSIDGVVQASTKYAITTSPSTRITFNNTSITATLQESDGAPKDTLPVRVFRETEVDTAKIVFAAGSAIRAQDLNNVFEQSLFAAQEGQGPTIVKTRIADNSVTTEKIKDRTIKAEDIEANTITANELAQNSVGASELDNNSVASANIINGSIVDEDISTGAEIQVNKLDDGSARQLLQTAANGSDVEWTSNVDIPGTLDVSSSAQFDNDTNVDGNFTVNTNKFTVNNSSGNTSTAGTLYVSGTSTIVGHLYGPSGGRFNNIQIGSSGTQEIDTTIGNLILDSTGGTVQVTDNFNVTGDADIDNNLNVDGTLTVDGTSTLTGNVTFGSNITGNLIGNASTATTLQNARTIGGVSFNGSANINLPGVNAVGNQNTTGSAAKLTTARTIGGVSFDGSANINLPGVNAAGTQDTSGNAATATSLAAASVITNAEQAAHTVNDTTFFTTSAAEARYFNASTSETIKDGDTFPDNDTTIATTAAINDRIIDLVDGVGGFHPVANEAAIPGTNVDVDNNAGTIVSIGVLSNTYTPSGGTATIPAANLTNLSNNLTISGCGSTVLEAGYGLLLETKALSDTAYAANPSYTFHRLVPKATEVTTVASKATEIGRLGTADMNILGTTDVVADMNLLGTTACVADMALLGTTACIADMATIADTSNLISNIGTVAGIHANVTTVAGNNSNVTTVATNIADVNNFADLYQIASSNPSTDGGGNALAEGDLYFNTSADELKIYNGTSWQGGVTATGNFATVTGNTFTGDNKYNDGVKALIGTGSDLEIFHTSDVNNIKSVNGKIVLATTAGNADIEVTPHGTGKVKLDGLSWPTADGSPSQYLKTNGSGVLSWGTISSDVVSDTSPQLGGNLDVNAKNIILADSAGASDDRIIFGDNSEFSIYYDTNANIVNTLGNLILSDSSGSIHLQSTAIQFDNAAGNEVLAKFTQGGAAELYHADDKKFYTNATGVYVEGGITSTQGYDIVGDSKKLRIGVSQDIELYHDGSHSYFKSKTGDTYLQTSGDKNAIEYNQNGAVKLYHNGLKKFETASHGINVLDDLVFDNGTNAGKDVNWNEASNTMRWQDSVIAAFGTGDDLKIYHDGSNAYLKNTTGNIAIEAKAGDMSIKCVPDGKVELYFNDAVKLQTDSTGVFVRGALWAEGIFYPWANNTYDLGSDSYRWKDLYISNDIDIKDNGELRIGDSDDLKLYHDTSHSYINHSGTGHLYLYGNGSNNIVIRANSAKESIIARPNTSVELYYNNAKEFQTVENGVELTSDTNANGTTQTIYLTPTTTGSQARSCSIAAVNTDGNNNNALIFKTCAADTPAERLRITPAGLVRVPDGGKFVAGNSDDLQMHHTGGHSYLSNKIGDLYLTQSADQGNGIFLEPKPSQAGVKIFRNGAVELNHSGNKKFETVSGGATCTGWLQGDQVYATDYIKVSDNDKIYCGSDNDLDLYHTGSAGFIRSGTGDMHVAAAGTTYFAQGGTSSWRYMMTSSALSPYANNTYDLGTSSYRWRNLYINDLQLSNEGSQNSVDGTWGDWTLQEGENDIFMLNNRSGKKYKMNLTEVN